MKKLLLLSLTLLSACAMPALQQQPVVVQPPAPVVSVPPVPAPVVLSTPVPLPAPVPVPVGPLTVLDASQVTVTLVNSTLTIALAPNVSGVWLRLTLPDKTDSAITNFGACHCIGLGGQGAHRIDVDFLAGLSVYTSASLDGPWTLAATTQ